MKINYKKLAVPSFFITLILVIILLLRRKPKTRLIASVNHSYIDPNKDFHALALQARNAFFGIDWTSTKAAVIEEMLYLNDDELKYLYNLYNETYHQNSPNKTLVSDLKNEWIWGSGVTRIKERFRTLNLT